MPQNAVDRLADVRVEMHRIDNLHIFVLRGDFSQRMTDLLETPAKAFTTMAGDKNGFAVVQERVARSEFCLKFVVSQHTVTHPNQGINNRIAGHKDFCRQYFHAAGSGANFRWVQSGTSPDVR